MLACRKHLTYGNISGRNHRPPYQTRKISTSDSQLTQPLVQVYKDQI